MTDGQGRGTVVVVDDDADARLLLRALLEHDGFEVVEAGGGGEGLQRLQDHPDAVLVILDLQMPEIDGREVLARMSAEPALRIVPALIRSGGLSPVEEEELRAGGAAGFLSKSEPPDQLFTLVRSLARRIPPPNPV